MPAPQSLVGAFDDSRYQVTQVLAGLEGDQWDVKSHPQAMSARETIQHLADCYSACLAVLDGNKYDFGSFRFDVTQPEEQLAKMLEIRDEAVARISASDDEKAFHEGNAFIILHDCYHVGQLATVRLAINPEWDAYSIYRF